MKIFRNILVGLFLQFYFFSGFTAWAVVYEPLPDMPYPADNPPTPEKEKLGSVLFFDSRLSGSNLMSCSSCHFKNQNWIDTKPRSIGIEGKELGRNSPTLWNSGYSRLQFWDGRAKSLEEQALMPIQDPFEMNQSLPALLTELSAIPEYPPLFKAAFGDQEITAKRISQAIATFERTLKTKDTDYDLYWKGDKSAMSPPSIRGMNLFFGKAKCSICHNGPRFTDDQFHNIGVSAVASANEDVGREKITREKFHLRAFKTPALIYISRTAPYMHNGSLETLEDVVEFYNLGGNDDAFKSPFISPIGLTATEKKDVVEFLKTLDRKEYPN